MGNALTSRRDLAEYLADLQSTVPQGQVVDTTVTAVAHREWRERFASGLQGPGLHSGDCTGRSRRTTACG